MNGRPYSIHVGLSESDWVEVRGVWMSKIQQNKVCMASSYTPVDVDVQVHCPTETNLVFDVLLAKNEWVRIRIRKNQYYSDIFLITRK